MRTCDVDGCEKTHRALGLCQMHYKRTGRSPRTTYPATCVTCAAVFKGVRADAKFCDDTCKGIWYSEHGVRPPGNPARRCTLPLDHPVRVLIRAASQERSPLRRAFEAGEWTSVLQHLEARAVKVDGCWLWPRADKSGYGRVVIAKRTFGAHRLSAMAFVGQEIPSHLAVHHKCAEPLCINPEHLQVVHPHENAAEMLERRYYKDRIAHLEDALRSLEPNHPLLPGHPLRLAS